MNFNRQETSETKPFEPKDGSSRIAILRRMVRSRAAMGALTLALLLAPVTSVYAENTELDNGNPSSQIDIDQTNNLDLDSLKGSTNSQNLEQVTQSQSESVEEEKNPRRWRRGDPVGFVGQFYSNIKAVFNEDARTHDNTWYNSGSGPKSLDSCRFQSFKVLLKPFLREVAVITCDRPGGQVGVFYGRPGQLRKDSWPRRGQQSQLTPENDGNLVANNLPNRGSSVAEILSRQGIQPNRPTEDRGKLGGPIAGQRPNPNYTPQGPSRT